MLRKQRSRNSGAGEHGEHRGPGPGPGAGVGVAQHGREDGGVRGLGEVLGDQRRLGPGDGGQLEQVFREGVVVVRHAGEEWKVGHKRDRE